MIIKVRTHPIDVYYVTGEDARQAREGAEELEEGECTNCTPCFATSEMGGDGWTWETAEQFEAEYTAAFGPEWETGRPEAKVSG